jgi:Uma2 family endonuclease
MAQTMVGPQKAIVVCQRNVARPDQWPRNYRIPDIVLMTADRIKFDRGDLIAGPPLVVVEIRSPNDESHQKLPFYAEFGVPEVWVVDRDAKSIEVCALREGDYPAAATDPKGWVISPATRVMLRWTPGRMLAVQLTANKES